MRLGDIIYLLSRDTMTKHKGHQTFIPTHNRSISTYESLVLSLSRLTMVWAGSLHSWAQSRPWVTISSGANVHARWGRSMTTSSLAPSEIFAANASTRRPKQRKILFIFILKKNLNYLSIHRLILYPKMTQVESKDKKLKRRESNIKEKRYMIGAKRRFSDS